MRRAWPPESIRVNATPVVNLFDTDADPIRIDDRRGEYRLTAHDSSGNRHQIHSVRQGLRSCSELHRLAGTRGLRGAGDV